MTDYDDYEELPHEAGYDQPKKGGAGKFVGICCVVLVVLFLVCGLGSYFFFQFGKKQRAMQYGALIQGYLQDDAQKKEAQEKFNEFVALSNQGKVGFVAFGIMENRFNDTTMDGQVTAEEFAHLMKLVDDIIAKNGEVNLQDYPAGR